MTAPRLLDALVSLAALGAVLCSPACNDGSPDTPSGPPSADVVADDGSPDVPPEVEEDAEAGSAPGIPETTIPVQDTTGDAGDGEVPSPPPLPPDPGPGGTCASLEQLLLAQLAAAGQGCEVDADCAFANSVTCDMGPHVTCHGIAHHVEVDISGIQSLFDTWADPAMGCPVIDCDCQATGAACFSGLCKPTGY